jgi:hypothetical protein
MLLGLCLFASPLQAAAYQPFGSLNCGSAGRSKSAVCSTNSNKDPISGPDGVLAHITNIVAFVAGAAAVIVIIVAGLRFITSGSDLSTNSRTDTDVENAKRTLANALIGLAIIALSRSIILFVLGKI